MELKAYIAPVIKYWWLLLLSALIAAISSFIVTRNQLPSYQSKATLLIGRAVYEPNPNGNDLYLNTQLASFYADLAMREPVRNGAMIALGMTWLPDYSAEVLPNSQLIEIDVMDTVPLRAQDVANELAKQLINQTPGNANQQDQSNQAFVSQQLAQLKTKITDTQNQIKQKQNELQNLNSARQIADAQQEISILESKLNTLQNSFALLLANSNQGANNTLTVIEPANLPTVPVGPDKKMMVLVSILLALVVSAGTAYLLEYLDDTLKTSEEIKRLTESPIVGAISEVNREEKDALYIVHQPRSTLSNAFRNLRTNLEFLKTERELKSLLITSDSAGEGKTFIATNLAIVFSQMGKKVVMLDIDFRRPNVHQRLSIPNEKGLSDVFLGNTNINDVMQLWNNQIQVIPSGTPMEDPNDLVNSRKMDQILDELSQSFDIIIIDGAPVFVSDTVIVSTKVDGVLLVVRDGHTRKGNFTHSIERLGRVGAIILGVVVNRSRQATDDYYYKHSYYSGEHSGTTRKKLFMLAEQIIGKQGNHSTDSTKADETQSI
jgi:polysaccharide biosynthesis transport protein